MSLAVKPHPLVLHEAADVGSRAGLPRLSQVAYAHIRDRLVLLDIAPGEPVSEEGLAAELQMGRTPVREALRRLEIDRLVVSFPRRGTFATEINVLDLAHIFEVRRQLEPLAARQAAVRAHDAEREGFRGLLAELGPREDDARSPRDLLEADLRMHRALYAATHNPFLEDTLLQYDNLATRIWGVFVDQLAGVAGHVDEHAPLLRAVIAADEDAAARLAAEHVLGFEEAVRARL